MNVLLLIDNKDVYGDLSGCLEVEGWRKGGCINITEVEEPVGELITNMHIPDID